MKRHKSLRIICNMETDKKILNLECKLQQKLVENTALAQEAFAVNWLLRH